jgi:hypothetical protein
MIIYLLNLILGSLEIVMSFADENISSNAMANEEKTNHMKETTANQNNIYLKKIISISFLSL